MFYFKPLGRTAERRLQGERQQAAGAAAREQESMNDRKPAKGGVDPRLLEILVCPITKGPLDYDAERQELISRQAGLAYPIRDGIPIMLPDEARPLED